MNTPRSNPNRRSLRTVIIGTQARDSGRDTVARLATAAGRVPRITTSRPVRHRHLHLLQPRPRSAPSWSWPGPDDVRCGPEPRPRSGHSRRRRLRPVRNGRHEAPLHAIRRQPPLRRSGRVCRGPAPPHSSNPRRPHPPQHPSAPIATPLAVNTMHTQAHHPLFGCRRDSPPLAPRARRQPRARPDDGATRTTPRKHAEHAGHRAGTETSLSRAPENPGIVPLAVELREWRLLVSSTNPSMLRHVRDRADGRRHRVQSSKQTRQPRTLRKCFAASSSALATQRWIIWPSRQRLTFPV